MIKVTDARFHESLDIEEDEIVLNGPPQSLTGSVVLKNKETQTVFIRDLALTPGGDDTPASQGRFQLLTALQAGEERLQQVTFQLPLNTPPGTYERRLSIGGREKSVRLIVQPNIEIDISPVALFFQGAVAGKTFDAEISLTNNGNLPFKVPSNIRHTTMLDEDYLCRALSFAIREKGGEGFDPVMDELTRNIHK